MIFTSAVNPLDALFLCIPAEGDLLKLKSSRSLYTMKRDERVSNSCLIPAHKAYTVSNKKPILLSSPVSLYVARVCAISRHLARSLECELRRKTCPSAYNELALVKYLGAVTSREGGTTEGAKSQSVCSQNGENASGE